MNVEHFQMPPQGPDEVVALQISPVYHGVPERAWNYWPGSKMPPVTVLLRIRDNDGNIMVDVLPSGRVVLSEHYDPDIVARRFWGGLMWFAEQHPLPGQP